jgi:hypothetical protein
MGSEGRSLELYDQLLASIGERSAEIEPRPLVSHWPHKGSAYRGLVIVGQALRGWRDDWQASEARTAEGRQRVLAMTRARNADRPEPLDWVPSHPKVRNSPFWAFARHLVEELEPDTRVPWWIVVEVSSRGLTRPTVIEADAEALRIDLDRGIRQKFLQVDSIVSGLIDDETKLTGVAARARRRFTRVLVVADGFPVNPLTYEAIQKAIPSSSTGADQRVGPGHVIDQEELDIAESISERHQGRLPSLLEQHEHSNLMRAAFKDFLLVELRLHVSRPKRIKEPGDRIWEPAFRAYGKEPPARDEA